MKNLYLLICFSIIIRLIAIYMDVSALLKSRVEVATPINSWLRVLEGTYLASESISPYAGDLFHEPPIFLYFYKLLMLSDFIVPYFFLIIDILTGYLLSLAAFSHLQKVFQEQETESCCYAKESEILKLKCDDIDQARQNVLFAYFLNPYIIVSCLGQTTAMLDNLFLALILWSYRTEKYLFCCISLALATYKSIYPVMLIVPAMLSLINQNSGLVVYQKKKLVYKVVSFFITFLFLLILLLMISYLLEGNWNFLKATYGFILLVPDLTPNVGLYWYFFTEMFQHFRLFFICTFQLNAFIHVIPLAVRFLEEPFLVMHALLLLMAIFQPYPCLANIGIALSLVPMWPHLLRFLRQVLLVSCLLIVCTIMAPVFWHLWLYAGSANANFYFGLTLAFNTAIIFLTTDLLFAYSRYRYHLFNGGYEDMTLKLILQ